ncbi:suppressor of cytokine signaling 6-like [Tigriopus californicus]|nr:suppressor of cytokine signaling 6-like [Tigriopus californicus]
MTTAGPPSGLDDWAQRWVRHLVRQAVTELSRPLAADPMTSPSPVPPGVAAQVKKSGRTWRRHLPAWLPTPRRFRLWPHWPRPRSEAQSGSVESLGGPGTRALPPVPDPPHLSGLARHTHSEAGLAAAGRLGSAWDLPATASDTPYIPEEEDLLAVTSTEPSSGVDFSRSIEMVKSYGWYWGPISGGAAERLLKNEPVGSFLVRDSSDDHYLFSLSFKLNNEVRHVRIEHDHGNFSFGTFTTFKSNTIVNFIENAVEHSRSGRYLFFLHRRPILGPMRVQLLNPVSRFKRVQSLQHQCRFVILQLVPRDLLSTLPLPNSLTDFLNTPFYYSELIANEAKLQPLSRNTNAVVVDNNDQL